MGDPSASVSPQLLHHLHAVCIIKYPLYQSIPADLLVDMLLKTPVVVQQYPFAWTMIEPPPQGSLVLSWRPPQMGTSCASDGYVWADAEGVHTIDAKGYQLEIYYHKAGFNPNPNLQQIQTHALFTRRCYRLKPQSPNTPPDTHNLWLLHYLAAERQNQLPIATISITPGARQSFSARSYIAQLFATGQLPRKEFYLGDPSTWPIIALPNQQQQVQQVQQVQHIQGIPMQQQGPPQTPQPNRHISPMNPRGTPQPNQPPPQGGYYTPARPAPKSSGPVPPSAKRLKPTPPSSHPGAAAAQAAALGVDPGMTIDEEEDTSRGDMLDHLSPREIATTRYIQHHEWMEEVLGSVYSISRIKPVDLGLGLRGELESVTKGLLEPAVYPTTKQPEVGEEKDQKEILEQFRPRVEKKIADIEGEIKKMEELHAARLAKISKSGVSKDAEKKLRGGIGGFMPPPAEQTTPEEGVDPLLAHIQSAEVDSKGIDEIVAEVEAAIGKKVVEKQMLANWEIPIEEIVNMGGIVAEGNGGLDTVMGGEEAAIGNIMDSVGVNEGVGDGGEDEFASLDLSSMIPGASGDNDAPLAVGGGFQHDTVTEGDLVGVDTIMDDFMNVVDSKPDTPAGEEKKEASIDGNPDDGFTFDGGEVKDELDEGIPELGLMEGGDGL